MGPHDSYVRIVEPPDRWDEILDTKLPILIESSCGDWDTIARDLSIAGLSSRFQVWLTETGQYQSVEPTPQSLRPRPQSKDWLLTIIPNERSSSKPRPLSGQHFILLRARGQNAKLAGKLSGLGARVNCLPMLEFTEPDDRGPLNRALQSLPGYDSVLFSSRNGVSHFLDELKTRGSDLRVLANKILVTIGPGTAETLASRGLKADLVADRNVAEGLLECLKAKYPGGLEGKRFLLPRAQVARDHICEELEKLGASVDDVPVYKTIVPSVSAAQFEIVMEQSILVVTSSSIAKHWANKTGLRPPCICIGPICSDTARTLGFPVIGSAPQHNLNGLVDFITSELATK